MPAMIGRRGRQGTVNYWPGFVDALSTLLLAIVFMISIFMLGQFFLAREISGRDTVLDRLNRQIAELTDLLALERSGRRNTEESLSSLQATLSAAEAERSRLQGLARYRSDFFGRLRQILGNRPDVRIVGDRFVFQSEVLFPVGQANLRPEAGGEVDRIASALVELERQVPPDIPWVIRVDGHTDQRPIATSQFPSNWALSSARAIAVVQYLISKGIPPQRLVAAGVGGFQPPDPAPTDEAHAPNPPIELK